MTTGYRPARYRTSLVEAEREGLAAIAAARLNPPKPDVEASAKKRARERAAELGHDLGPIRAKGAGAQLVGRCRKCDAAVVFRPEDVVANPLTGEFFGGRAVTEACR